MASVINYTISKLSPPVPLYIGAIQAIGFVETTDGASYAITSSTVTVLAADGSTTSVTAASTILDSSSDETSHEVSYLWNSAGFTAQTYKFIFTYSRDDGSKGIVEILVTLSDQ